MKKATISETKNRFSHYVDLAKSGQTILITDHGKPVVSLQSIARSQDQEPEGRLHRLERNGVLQVAQHSLGKSFFSKPRPKPKAGGSILKALLDEREESQ